nr:ryanodine receptor 1-like [Camelus dromedarius]
MAMSLLGHYNNFFFAAHLLDIAMGVKTLRTILSSVTHDGKQLVMTLGLLAVEALPVHRGGLQLLPQALQQERGRGRA